MYLCMYYIVFACISVCVIYIKNIQFYQVGKQGAERRRGGVLKERRRGGGIICMAIHACTHARTHFFPKSSMHAYYILHIYNMYIIVRVCINVFL